MSVDYKIKEVFKQTKFTLMKYAAERGVAFQSLSRKVNHGKWTVDQLFELAKITGCKFQCCFIFNDGSRLYLHDLEKEGDVIMPTDYKGLLYEKVSNEYNVFLDSLYELPVEKAMNKAYEKVMKEEFVSFIENNDIEQMQAKALYKQKYPLDYCYQEWLKNDYSITTALQDTMTDASEKATRVMKEKKREGR